MKMYVRMSNFSALVPITMNSLQISGHDCINKFLFAFVLAPINTSLLVFINEFSFNK